MEKYESPHTIEVEAERVAREEYGGPSCPSIA